MRFQSNFFLFLLAITTFTFFSCSNKTEEFISEPLSDYIPLQTGKYITYRLDSLVFTNFGRNIETHRYQVKHVVDAQVTDNLGRPAYRIYTYIRDSAGTQSWTADGSYFITPLANQTEVTADNLRVIRLHLPVREGYEWAGNSYLPDEPYKALYDFSNDDDMKTPEWNFAYEAPGAAFSYRNQNYTDVLTVEEIDDSQNLPVTNVYAYKTRAVEKYSKNIGLIYRQYELWEFQPNTSGPSPFYTGFGIRLWMIDHN
jgi:hypothetical protein